MKLNKLLRIFSIVFESSFIGSIILYIYNYYISSKKYDVIPGAIKANLNIFIIIAVVSFILFLILKYVLYIRNKTVDSNISQMEMNFEQKNDYESAPVKSHNLEEPSVERVIIYKDSYDVPKEKRMLCPNCNNIIDKSAFICLKCGILLKSNVSKEKEIEKHPHNTVNRPNLRNIVINLCLVIAIIICIIFIVDIAIERGIIK